MACRNPDSALQELMAGNQRYVDGTSLHPHQTAQRRQELISHQEPFATIMGCSDSRVPPELIFDQGFGDLFVVRVAGNIVDEEAVVASLEYAVDHLKTPLLMVLGHKSCGAVRAAMDALATKKEGTGHLQYVVDALEPAVAMGRIQPGDVLDNAVRANVQRTVRRLKQSEPVFSALVRDKKLNIVGAYYDLESGRVELLDGAR